MMATEKSSVNGMASMRKIAMQGDEEEHGICRAEGLHPLDQHGRPPLTLPRRNAAAHFRLTGALRRLDCSREENPQQSFTLGSHCDAHAGVQLCRQ